MNVIWEKLYLRKIHMNKFALIIIRIFLTYLLNESAINFNNWFNMNPKVLNQMIFIYFTHCASYGGLQRPYRFIQASIDFSLDDTPYIIVQLIQGWRSRRPYAHPFLDRLDHMKWWCIFLFIGIQSLFAHALYSSPHNPLQSPYNPWPLSPVEKSGDA